MFVVTERWQAAYPDAMVGALVVRGATNVAEHPELERRKRVVEAEARSRFRNPDDIKGDGAVRSYVAYYRRYEKTYHLVQQLKTLVVKQRPLPTVSGLVDVMFMAEMKNLLLTAGHDMATIVPPVTLDVAAGNEEYIKLNQEHQAARAGDMMMTDERGILSTIIDGPDYRSRIGMETKDALYIIYAPHGIGADDVICHAGDISAGIHTFSSGADVEPLRLLSVRGVESIQL